MESGPALPWRTCQAEAIGTFERSRCRLCIMYQVIYKTISDAPIPRFFDWVVPHLVGVVAGLTKLAEAQSWWSDESTRMAVPMDTCFHEQRWNMGHKLDVRWEKLAAVIFFFLGGGWGGHAHAKCGGQDVHTSGWAVITPDPLIESTVLQISFDPLPTWSLT